MRLPWKSRSPQAEVDSERPEGRPDLEDQVQVISTPAAGEPALSVRSDPEPAAPAPEPAPVLVAEPPAERTPEPEPVLVAGPEPQAADVAEPVLVAEPEPAAEPEPERESVLVAEPEPQAADVAQPVLVAEPEPAAEPEPEPADVAESVLVAEPEPQAADVAQPVPSVPAARTGAPQWPRPERTRVIAVANQKGGCAKTTSVVNLAAGLAQAGLNVLVLDLDPQGNASTALGLAHHVGVPSMYDVIVDRRPIAEVVAACPDVTGLVAAPATIDLAGADLELISKVDREHRLRSAVAEYLATRTGDDRVDYVLIDCPPSLSLLTVNAFTAASEVLIPVQCEYYALEGLSQLLKHIELVRAHLNPELVISSLLLTMYDSRTRLSAQVADEVRTHFPDQVAKTVIPRSVRISEAPSHGQTVLTYDPTCPGAICYREAARELALIPASSGA